MKSPWEWKQHGSCGKWVSSLVPHLASSVDDMAFLHSMISKSNVHGPATFMQNSGFVLPGFPSMGAWVSYGLGSLNENLPTFVVLPDVRGFAPNGPGNWTTLKPSGPVTVRPPTSNLFRHAFPLRNPPRSCPARHHRGRPRG